MHYFSEQITLLFYFCCCWLTCTFVPLYNFRQSIILDGLANCNFRYDVWEAAIWNVGPLCWIHIIYYFVYITCLLSNFENHLFRYTHFVTDINFDVSRRVEVVLYKIRATKKRASGVIMVYYLVLGFVIYVCLRRLLHVDHFGEKK